MKKLWWSYVALAALALTAIFSSLLIVRQVMTSLGRSVASAGSAIARSEANDRLADLATQIDLPGNRVFENGDVAGESKRMEQAVEAFGSALQKARPALIAGLPRDRAAQVTAAVDDVQRSLIEVHADAHRIFDVLAAGDFAQGAAQMARMDEDDARLRRDIGRADQLVHAFREEQIRRERDDVVDASSYETATAVLMIFAIAALVVYGRTIIRHAGTVNDLYRREEELRRANLAFENAISGVSFIDKEGRYALVSRAIAAALGYDGEEMIGMPTAKTLHPDDTETIRRSNDELKRTGKSEVEIRAVGKDGRIVDTRLVRIVSRDDHGNFLGHYSFAKDISEQKRAEAALRRSEERFQLATRAANDVIFDWNIRTGEAWVSEAWQAQFGYASWGDVGLAAWSDALHPEDRERTLAAMQNAITSHQHVECEYRLRRADGTYADAVTRSYVIYGASGEPLRMVGATMDITARKRAERAHTAQLLNAAADGILGIDSNGRITFANQSAARMLAWTSDELTGKNVYEDVFGRSAADSARDLLIGETKRSDKELFCRRDGSTFAAEYECTPIRDDGAPISGVFTFRDISERRAIETMKDEFVSIVSHELRTPLTSIRGALGLLAGGRIGQIPPIGKRMLDIAVSNTDRLVRLINDILDIERMESGKVTLVRQFCDAQTLMWHAIESMRAMAERAGVELECGVCDETVLADSDRVVQTLTNLLSNAIKFSPAGSKVTLSASAVDGRVMFEIADQGRGIPLDKLELIFERFQQVDASDAREKGGSGLGLSICRSIVRQHGGDIWAESVPGVGSRFRFTIPCSEVAVLETASAARTVMLCDDDSSIREAMSALLEQRGYRPVSVSSGSELLSRVDEIAPDVVLLDLLMPGLNGFETLAKLKANPRTAAIPVVIMSIFSQSATEWPVGDLAGWVQKPMDERSVVNALEQALSHDARRQVLLVEDDVDLAGVIAAGFARHGVKTIHVTGGRAAIAEASKKTPDLLVLDIALPDIDGYAVIDWLKDHDMLRSVPVVVYSASEPTPSQRDRLTLGPTQFLTKSRIAPEEFERRIIQLLDNVTGPAAEMSHVA